MWVYQRTESQLFTVGFYDPQGKWHPDSDCPTRGEAAERVRYLNGDGNPELLGTIYTIKEGLNEIRKEIRAIFEALRDA